VEKIAVLSPLTRPLLPVDADGARPWLVELGVRVLAVRVVAVLTRIREPAGLNVDLGSAAAATSASGLLVLDLLEAVVILLRVVLVVLLGLLNGDGDGERLLVGRWANCDRRGHGRTRASHCRHRRGARVERLLTKRSLREVNSEQDADLLLAKRVNHALNILKILHASLNLLAKHLRDLGVARVNLALLLGEGALHIINFKLRRRHRALLHAVHCN